MSGNPSKWEPDFSDDPLNITGKYILKHRKPIECPNLQKWGRWLQTPYNKRVRGTYVGDAWISTVFLGLDHSHEENAEPVLFETMLFAEGDEDDQTCTRTTSWRKALGQHWDMVRKIKNEQRQ